MVVQHLTPFKFRLIGARDLYDKELPPIQYLVDDFIIQAGLTYIVGPPASFKTGLMMLISIAGACRSNVIGFDIKKPFRTLFIDEENGIINTKDRFVKLIKGLDVDIHKDVKNTDIIFSNISSFVFIKHHVDGLEEEIKKYKPDLIIIDNIARCLQGSERDEQDVSLILKLIKPLIETYGVAFVIIHHTRKGNAKTLEDISGSRDFGGQCDNAFMLKQFGKTDNVKKFVLTQVKSKYGVEMDAINFSVSGDDVLNVRFLGTASENIKKSKASKIVVDVMKFIEDNPQPKYRKSTIIDEMSKKHKHKETNIRNAMDLIDEMNIWKNEYGYCVMKGKKDE